MMNKLKQIWLNYRLTKVLLAIILLSVCFTFDSCKVVRFIVYNFADIGDHKKFPSRPVHRGDETFSFVIDTHQKVLERLQLNDQRVPFESYLKDNKTVAFLIIKNDSIQYERYWNGYNAASIVPSFSVAKSITSILIGCALDDKLIQSVDEPITNYIPELRKNGFDRVTIEHLLQMTSGMDFNEGYYNPFGHVATFYYGTNLRKAIKKLKLKRAPGENFEYVSGNTQLLGLILERALKTKTVSTYLQEKLWIPLQMEHDASWSLDRQKEGLEKTFCCINATARDYAKIGRLYLNGGNWNGKQIVSRSWVEQSTTPSQSSGSESYYQYQWWIPSKGTFLAQGILGQYIYVDPSKNLIIVRLGANKGEADWWQVFAALSEIY